jgi:hypothetical protein
MLKYSLVTASISHHTRMVRSCLCKQCTTTAAVCPMPHSSLTLMGVGPWVDHQRRKTFAPILIWISVCHAMPFLAAMVLFFLLPVIVFFL